MNGALAIGVGLLLFGHVTGFVRPFDVGGAAILLSPAVENPVMHMPRP